MGGRGRTLTNEPGINLQLMCLLNTAWQDGFTVSSDFARRNAALVAMAASLQLITTRVNSQVFSQSWQITAKGLRWLNEETQ